MSEDVRRKLAELEEAARRVNLDIAGDLSRIDRKLRGDSPPPQANVAWGRVELARNPDRPTTLDYVRAISEEYIELHGDRAFADDPALVGGIARIAGVHFTFLGHQKGKNMKENLKRNYGMAQPEGYRKALRLAYQAEKFGRPIVTFVDTQGAFPGMSSEERGISEAIARNLREFSVLRVPIVTFVVGEGGSGGALGIAVADRVYMLENSTYSVITPEGCASILLRDSKRAKYAAELLRLTAQDLRTFGITDGVLPEAEGGAQNDLSVSAEAVKSTLLDSYAKLRRVRVNRLLRERSRRLLSFGDFADPAKRTGWRPRIFPSRAR